MVPAVHLALALFFFPTLILSEPLHVPLTHRRHTKLIRDWTDEANNIRKRYGYPIATSQSRRSSRREVAGIPLFDQVDIQVVIVFRFISTYHKNRVQILILLI